MFKWMCVAFLLSLTRYKSQEQTRVLYCSPDQFLSFSLSLVSFLILSEFYVHSVLDFIQSPLHTRNCTHYILFFVLFVLIIFFTARTHITPALGSFAAPFHHHFHILDSCFGTLAVHRNAIALLSVIISGSMLYFFFSRSIPFFRLLARLTWQLLFFTSCCVLFFNKRISVLLSRKQFSFVVYAVCMFALYIRVQIFGMCASAYTFSYGKSWQNDFEKNICCQRRDTH